MSFSSASLTKPMERLRKNGFEAWISTTVDGVVENLPQFELEDNGVEATCWIPSEAGKEFAVRWRCTNPPGSQTLGKVKLDGNSVGGAYTQKDGSDNVVSGMYTSRTSLRPFMFSTVQLTDDDNYLQASLSQSIGEIAIDIGEVTLGEISSTYTCVEPPPESKIHEKSKKGTSHRVNFGEAKSVLSRSTQDYHNFTSVAKFKLKYRPIEILRANGIAPQLDVPELAAEASVPPEPTTISKSTEKKRKAVALKVEDISDDEHEDDDEVKALLAKLNELRSKRKGKPAKKVKTEYRPIQPGEIIDLT